MAKKVLKIDYSESFDFFLAGIVCGYKDYRLCFEVNKELGVQLRRINDHAISTGKLGAQAFFSFYSFKNKSDKEFYIIANKGTAGNLIPEKAAIDFFLLVKTTDSVFDFKTIIKQLRTLEVITAITEVNVNNLKSAENLLFD